MCHRDDWWCATGFAICHCDRCKPEITARHRADKIGQPVASAAAAEQVYQSGADAATHAAMQHYAARTVENIAALGGSWAAAMADGLLINNLVSLWRGTRRVPHCSVKTPGCDARHCTCLRCTQLHTWTYLLHAAALRLLALLGSAAPEPGGVGHSWRPCRGAHQNHNNKACTTIQRLLWGSWDTGNLHPFRSCNAWVQKRGAAGGGSRGAGVRAAPLSAAAGGGRCQVRGAHAGGRCGSGGGVLPETICFNSLFCLTNQPLS
jgi:hypothetical protein